jgi:hypothetical protein
MMLAPGLGRGISLTALTALFLLFSLLLTENTLAAPTITIEPPQNFPGTRVIVTGAGWPSGDQIKFTWSKPIGTNAKTGVGVWADATGAFSAMITVPQGASVGLYTLGASNEAGNQATSTSFTVLDRTTFGPLPGWYSPGSSIGGTSIIYEDKSSGLLIVWTASYIYQHPGKDNLYL